MTASKVPALRPVKRARRSELFARRPVILAIVLAMLAGAIYLLIVRPQPPITPPSYETGRPVTAGSPSSSDPVARVAGHLLVNPDEKPYVATITDLEAARKVNPVFYQNAELGDKVLFWSDKAVIYSPSKDRIVSVISIAAASASATSSVPILENVTIEVRNGSGVPGAARKMREKLRAEGFKVSRIGDADRRSAGTTLIDLTSGKAPNALLKLTGLVGASVVTSTLPAGETGSDADLLVILGVTSTSR